VSAFQLVPLVLDRDIINHSRLEAAWKWDSYGAGQVLEWLFTGQLLDHGRLPVLTVLAAAALVILLLGKAAPAHLYALLGAALWILVLFGRPFWGPALWLIGISPDMHLHRVIGGAQVFLVFLGAIALAGIWRELARRVHVAAAVALTALLLYPMVRERAAYLAVNDRNGHENLRAYQADRAALDAILAKAREKGGRAYAGMAWNWGPSFKIGFTPVYAFLSEAGVPAVAYLYHTMALTADVMSRFDDSKEVQYRLFNIRSFLLPAKYRLPEFLTFRDRAGPLQIYDTPAAGYFDVVDVPAAARINKDTFFDLNDRWMHGDWLANQQYLRLDLRDGVQPALPRVEAGSSLPAAPVSAPPGRVVNEWQRDEVYAARVEAQRPAFVLFRMTWHSCWKVYVDGKGVETAMLSPGFVGAPIAAGSHEVECRYEPGWWKIWMALGGVIAAAAMGFSERVRARE